MHATEVSVPLVPPVGSAGAVRRVRAPPVPFIAIGCPPSLPTAEQMLPARQEIPARDPVPVSSVAADHVPVVSVATIG